MLQILKRTLRYFFSNKRAIELFEKLSGTMVLQKIPVGLDSALDIKYRLNGYVINTIFDVGANVGQSAVKFRKKFPNATIHSFEPVSNTFNVLKENTALLKINCHHFALGDENKTLEIKIDAKSPHSVSNSLVEKNSSELKEFLKENIAVKKLDTFVSENKIDRISYLKIDTEGFDLEVLKGAEYMLKNQKIDFIECEVSMNPANNFHISLNDICNYLYSHNYFLFGIYEQVHDFKLKKPVLRRVNALFISSETSEQYKL